MVGGDRNTASRSIKEESKAKPEQSRFTVYTLVKLALIRGTLLRVSNVLTPNSLKTVHYISDLNSEISLFPEPRL